MTSWGTFYRALLTDFGTTDYHLGEYAAGFDQDADGVEVRFTTGRRERADLVVFADGITSTLLGVSLPAPVWWAIVALLMTLVLALELVNAAIEAIIDRLHPDLHDDMRDAKDMASGAVLLMAVAAIVVAGALAVEMGWR